MTQARTVEANSKIDQIRKIFRDQIRRGELMAGDRIPSERELASEFGVNLLTINKAMAVLESERMLDRKSSRGTYIHPDVSRGHVTVVFDACHFVNPELSGFSQCLLRELTKTVHSHDMRSTHVLGHGESPESFVQSLDPRSSFWYHTAGVLALADLGTMEQELFCKGVPTVTITTLHEQGMHSIRMDYDDLAFLMFDHLLSRGCKRIGIIFNRSTENTSLFKTNLKQRMLNHSSMLDQRFWIESCTTAADGYDAITHLWQKRSKPDGLIVMDENTAKGVLHAAKDLHVDMPDKLKLITHATNGVECDFGLDVTRAEFDLKQLCTTAFEFLYQLMIKEADRQEIVLKARIRQGVTT